MNLMDKNPFDLPGISFDVAQWVTRIFSITIEVFWRYDFGERYFEPLSVLGYSLLTGGGLISVLLLIGQLGREGAWPLILFFVAFIVMGIWHRIVIIRRRWNGELWHSRYPGSSWPFWKALGLKQSIVQLYCEPLASFLVGSLLMTLDPLAPLGIWLVLASLCLGITGQIDLSRSRNQFLNIMDAQIEAKYFAKAVEGASPDETAGYYLPIATSYSPKITQVVKKNAEDMYRDLDPRLKALITRVNPPPPPSSPTSPQPPPAPRPQPLPVSPPAATPPAPRPPHPSVNAFSHPPQSAPQPGISGMYASLPPELQAITGRPPQNMPQSRSVAIVVDPEIQAIRAREAATFTVFLHRENFPGAVRLKMIYGGDTRDVPGLRVKGDFEITGDRTTVEIYTTRATPQGVIQFILTDDDRHPTGVPVNDASFTLQVWQG